MGLRELGVGTYLAHFAGPIWWLAWLMLPIELISHMARPLSLSVRLYANMYAGEQVTLVFLGLTYFLAPAIFMGLHGIGVYLVVFFVVFCNFLFAWKMIEEGP